MDFYTAISDYYDYIFPINTSHISFIEFFQKTHSIENQLLDVGCSTGSLALALAEKGFTVQAIDFDPDMIQMAEKKKAETGKKNNPLFQQMDMRNIADTIKPGSFDIAYCFGNTLVHLLTDTDILLFLDSIKKILKPHGLLLIQILNYENIITNNITNLPLIDNEKIMFERFYDLSSSSQINFKTRLTIKATGKIIENSIPLRPLYKTELETLLLKTGFSHLEFYGNFHRAPLTSDSLPLVVKAEN